MTEFKPPSHLWVDIPVAFCAGCSIFFLGWFIILGHGEDANKKKGRGR